MSVGFASVSFGGASLEVMSPARTTAVLTPAVADVTGTRIVHEPPAASVIALMDADAAPLGATTKPPQSDVTLPPAFTRPDEYTLLNWMPCTASAFGLKREKVSIEVPPTAMLGGSKARRTVGAASDKTIRRALVPAADTTPSAP